VISGLSPGTTCHYRLVASNSAGTAYGADATVKTLSPPAATTKPPTNVTSSSAQLNGTVTPNGLSTTWWFEYGTTTAYGSSTSIGSLPAGYTATAVMASLTGLLPSKTYHFRLVATNSLGTVYGADKSFKTLAS